MAEKKQTAVATGGTIPEGAFHRLTLADKRGYLQSVPGRERMNLILSDPDARQLTRALEPQEFFWLLKEVGEHDALGLLQLASGEQCQFVFDIELWQGWSFSEEKTCHWLTYLMEGGEPRIHELLK